MTPTVIFNLQSVLGYVAWSLCFAAYGWPKLRSMNAVDAARAIAALHSFRFFGLAFAFPGLIGAAIPASFAVPAAWGDLATGFLAMLALASFQVRPLFWLFVAGFNLVGTADLLMNYYHAVRAGLPEVAGDLGPAYLIPVLYVPILMITHVAAFALIARRPWAAPIRAASTRSRSKLQAAAEGVE
jgi:hypothetical protein